MIRRMLLLGATGDLSLRYLLPALAHLRQANGLPEDSSSNASAATTRTPKPTAPWPRRGSPNTRPTSRARSATR